MNQAFAIVLTSLFLTACGNVPVKDDLPASDLTALQTLVTTSLPPRPLPNGKLYCVELARTQGDKDDCDGDLEDNVYTREQDRLLTIKEVDSYVFRERLIRNPCSWWERLRRATRCSVK